MTARRLLPTQPITQKGDLPSRDLVEVIQRLVSAVGAGGGGAVSDGDYGDVVVSGAGTVWAIDTATAASYRARASHTGTQLAATVSNLATTVQAYTLDTFANPVAAMDFAQQQSQRFVIENRTSDPGAPVAGEIWLRTDL